MDPPKSVAGVPVSVTSIGIGEPWLIEQRCLSAEAPGAPLKMVGGVHAVPSPWLFSEVAMILAGLCWAFWFLLKRSVGERLDSRLDQGEGKRPSLGSAGYLWIGASAFCLWLCFSILGLMMFFRREWDLPVSLQSLAKGCLVLAVVWVGLGFFQRRWGGQKDKLPEPGPWPARLVGVFSLIALAGFIYAASRPVWRSQTAPSMTPTVQVEPRTVATTDVHLELLEKTSVVDGDQAREGRQLAVISEKPGFLHFWADGHDPMVVPMLPEASGKSYRRNLIYSVGKAERAVLHYRVITDNTQKEAEQAVDLANRHITFDQMAKSFREVADPVGKCLRNVPLDLVPLGDHAGSGSLWIAVSDTDAPLHPDPMYLHIWHPTYHTDPPALPAGLATDVANIGEIMSHGDKKIGRISQRDGRFMADLEFSHGSISYFKGELTPEVPVEPTGFAFSGAVWPVRFVLTRKPEVISFLEAQVKLDQQKRKKP